jgi:hypothetical protein
MEDCHPFCLLLLALKTHTEQIDIVSLYVAYMLDV